MVLLCSDICYETCSVWQKRYSNLNFVSSKNSVEPQTRPLSICHKTKHQIINKQTSSTLIVPNCFSARSSFNFEFECVFEFEIRRNKKKKNIHLFVITFHVDHMKRISITRANRCKSSVSIFFMAFQSMHKDLIKNWVVLHFERFNVNSYNFIIIYLRKLKIENKYVGERKKTGNSKQTIVAFCAY